jgi:hypothetical protein
MKYFFAIVFSFWILLGFSQPDIDFASIATNFNRPVDIANAGDGSNRLFIVEKPGIIKIIDLSSNTVLSSAFLNIESRVDDASNEQGLLGLAFHPNYSANGFFYVNYVHDPGPGLDRTRISRFQVSSNPNIANASSESILLEIEQDFGNHNGGDINFGPDGYLYIGMGDGGSGGDPNCRAQDPDELLGKMLRIDVNSGPPVNTSGMCGLIRNYGIPASNPFSDASDGICDEIWATGLRNPWRFSFDAQTGDMWIADVGQNQVEEIDFQPAASTGGENYGWRIMEGNNCFDNTTPTPPCPEGLVSCFDASLVDPVFEYSHNFGCSVTGGFRYRGSQSSGLIGHYVFMDYCSDRLWTLSGSPGNWSSTVKTLSGYGNITTFGEDENGEMYAANDFQNASVYKLFDEVTVGVDLINFRGKREDNKVRLFWQAANPVNFSHFEIEKSHNAKDFFLLSAEGFKKDDKTYKLYQHFDTQPNGGDNFYRLKMIDRNGAYEYSKTINIPFKTNTTLQIFPNPVKDKLIINFLQNVPDVISKIEIINVSGQKILDSYVETVNPEISVNLESLQSGIYFLKMYTNQQILIHKIYKE